MSTDWLKKLKQYAPDIASAVLTGGATLPALAIKAVADATGQPVESMDQLQNVVSNATPDQMVKVTQANNNFKIRMRELDNELVNAELGDKQHARATHKSHPMPAIICIAMTLIVAVGGYLLFTIDIPESNLEISYLLFGAVLTKWGDSVSYWVGTTRSSSVKTTMIKGQR